MTAKFYWKTNFAVIAPENLDKLDSPLGVSRGGSAPFCWRSRNQEVPCESLVPFFSQERNCQCGRHEPTKAKTFLKLCFEAECIYSIWDSAPNNTFEKTKVSLCAEAEILQYTRVRNSDQLQAGYINGAKARSKERKIRIGALTARSFSSVISSQMFWVRRKSSLTLETIGDR